MSDPRTNILAVLQGEGKRITMARRALIDLFIGQKKPLNLKDINELLLANGVKIHKATLYREVEFLVGQSVIQQVNLGTGEALYESMDREHHHHMVCLDCKVVKEVPVQKELELAEINMYKRTGFSMIKHAVEFFGLCKKCQKSY